tara:strand:+ start:601 stop:1050 length:450 start_codon:yes stop_codon:yes gene_type:complete
MKKIFFVLLFIVASCGYQPLYNTDKEIDKIKISDIKIIGDISLGKKIYSNLALKIVKDKSLYKLILNNKKNIVVTSKDSKGQVVSYRTTITVQLSFLDNEDNLIKDKTLSKDFLYNTKDNKFKLKEYQIEIENNLINKITEDINIYLKF